MATKVRQSLILDDGGAVILPPEPGTNLRNLDIPNVYADETVQAYPLGAKYITDERIYRYSYAGAALKQGYLCESAALGGALTTAQIDLAVAAVAAGASDIYVTADTTSQPANRFQHGWISIVSGTNAQGAGQGYRIQSHVALTAASSCAVTIFGTVGKAITTDCKASLYANLYYAIKHTAATTPVGMPLGVPNCDIASGSYGWLQTWGPCPTLTGSTTTVNSEAIRGVEEGESDIQASAGITPMIGIYMEVGADGDFPLTYLMLDK